ncbi:MAG: flagellar basal body L-ring protein FlgH [Saccharospirillaceae bacterium]|jgi:flagellar L-ring protein precursor FlgH|nr:flagellar basal body L-ring protein [Thalassolituus sp. HI0120]MCH2039454.1 flagellar basal body L-ring protein FlgH [Saccharospirillaceae bacterium]
MRYLLISLSILFIGCTSVPLEKDIYPDDPDYAPVSAQSLQPPPSVSGSLFSAGYPNGFFTDQQARRIGDIITVIFDERYRSQKSAETKSDKSSENSANAGNLLGTVPGFRNMDLGVDLKNERKFAGKGEADRSNSLTGLISVSVADILPNGILKIRGEKWLTISEGDEYIRITGMIRPQDITPDNTVVSSKVADARISFGGRGSLNNATKHGWADRIFNSPWWPF